MRVLCALIIMLVGGTGAYWIAESLWQCIGGIFVVMIAAVAILESK